MSVHTHVRDGVLVVELDNPPVNAISQDVRAGLLDAVEAGERDDSIVAFVIAGRNGAFSGGADIREFGKPSADPTLPAVLARIEASSKPFVAAVDGFAFGGGFEIALACDARLGTDRARVNLPEINLGLLPGAGGTQRLPRLIGAEESLRIILGGPPVRAERACELGILERAPDEPIETACAFARSLVATGRRRLSERTVAASRTVFDAARLKAEPAARGGLAAQRCIDAVEAAGMLAFGEGLARERELFLELRDSAQSRGRIHLFFAERETVKVPGISRDVPVATLARACVVGAGTMGTGIAMVFANAGIDVDVVENGRDALDRGCATIERTYAAAVGKGRMSQKEADERRARLQFGTDLEAAAAAADVVVEAAFEDLDVKRAVFANLDRVCRPGTLLATNTSTLDIDAIAAATTRPHDVIGLHFFSPAHVMRLLEIVRGAATSDGAIATALALAKKLKKVGVVARTCDGFIGNRMLAGYVREAAYLLEEGALPEDVDRAIREFGFAMGPFAMSDLAGLDVGRRIAERRLAERRRDAVRESEIGLRLCELGRFGQKSGGGFFRYEAESRTPLADPIVRATVVAESERLGIARRDISDEEIVLRCMLPLVNEGARIVADGTAIRSGDIDVVWACGYGFPAFRGGPMQWADEMGLAHVVDRLRRFERVLGTHWRPAPLLVELAEAGRRFGSAS